MEETQEVEEEPMEEDEDAKVKAEAEEEKKKGSEAYRKKDFVEAERAFLKAWELWPKDITYLTNLSGTYDYLFYGGNSLILQFQPCISKQGLSTNVSRPAKRLSRRAAR